MTRGWAPGWQQDARAVLAGEMTVAEAVERTETQHRPGAAYESNVVTESQAYEPEQPMLFGRADMADTSTCTDLVVASEPGVIWDVNGYYRALGIPFPHRPVTRRSLMAAHLAAGGLDDRWKTYALKQLLDLKKRNEYNWMGLDQVYIDDYWNEYFDRQARINLHRRVAAGEIELEDVTAEAVTAVKEDWGLAFPEEGLDVPSGASKSTAARCPSPRTAGFTWSYYLWRCGYTATRPLISRLDDWRTLLVEEFRDQDLRLKFRVGFMGKQPHPWMRLQQGGHLILLLNENQVPTKEYAAQAAHFTRRELSGHTDTVMIEEGHNGLA